MAPLLNPTIPSHNALKRRLTADESREAFEAFYVGLIDAHKPCSPIEKPSRRADGHERLTASALPHREGIVHEGIVPTADIDFVFLGLSKSTGESCD